MIVDHDQVDSISLVINVICEESNESIAIGWNMLTVGSTLLYIIHIHIEVNIREGLYPDPISAVKQVRSIWLDGEILDTLH